MPLHRIRAASLGGTEALRSRLRAEGIQLERGRTVLNQRTEGASVLIVVRGVLRVGVADDDATLAPGEGVLLPAETVYALQAPEEVVAVLFTLPGNGVMGPEGPAAAEPSP